jgi:biopolymer transport protein ExbB
MLQEQSQEIASELLNETESVERTISIMEMIMNGGAAGIIIIGILFVLLFIAVYIYFERIFAIRAASKIDRNFMNQIKEQVASGNIQGAKILCAQNNTPVARISNRESFGRHQ